MKPIFPCSNGAPIGRQSQILSAGGPRQTGFLRTIGPDETFCRLASFAKMELSSLDNRVAPQVVFHQI